VVERVGEEFRLLLHGEVDLANADELRTAADAADGATRVVVDLSRCTFLDSSALSVFARFLRRADDGCLDFRIVQSPRLVCRILEITGFGPYLERVGPDGSQPGSDLGDGSR
jgi:anti-anti-sigma factor